MFLNIRSTKECLNCQICKKKSYNRGMHDHLFLFVWATFIPSKQYKNRFEHKADRLVFSLARIYILPESLLSATLMKQSDTQQQAATGQGVNTFTCQPDLWLTYNTCGWPPDMARISECRRKIDLVCLLTDLGNQTERNQRGRTVSRALPHCLCQSL